LSKHHFYPVILAGGSGTRFWPRSRRRLAKQVLALDGKRTMIQTTVERLLPMSSETDFWVITNEFVSKEIRRQLPRIPVPQVVVEPQPRNTAPAIGLAAFLLEKLDPQSIIGMFPADHVKEFIAAGNYYWNSGMFVWSVRTLTNALREHFSESAPYLEEIAGAWGTKEFDRKFARLYPKCENISIDYAVLEPRSAKGQHSSNLFCLRADFGWNDLGSWAALYDHHAVQQKDDGRNVVDGKDFYAVNAARNYIYAPEKFVAAVGVNDLVVVETEDAILVTTREHSQDVGKIVKYLTDKKMTELV